MKLRDFNKKSKANTQSNKFVLNNDAAEKKYKNQLDDLNTQLGHYRNIESERDLAVKRLDSIEETLKSERFDRDELRERLEEYEKTVQDQDKQLGVVPALEEDYRNAKGLAALKASELDAMTKRAVQQSQDLSVFKEKVETLENENKTLVQTTAEAVSRKQSAEAEFEAISNKNKELKSFTDETSKINKELVEENKTLRDWANYKDVENKELLVQLEELKIIETKLREWMGKIETKDSNNTLSKNSLENKVSTQQKVITDMSNTLDDMMKEITYITKLNREYRKELAKPTYTSMSAIASQEGFVMPNGKENIRTHNLGNYKPTMLKFKKQEEAKNGG
jgi:chromosome segregation ATPase